MTKYSHTTDPHACTHVRSGLDSTTAFHIVDNLRGLAKRGRTVLLTIHQPASEMFPLFDRILMLSRGKVVFFGSGSEALSHFGRVGFECPEFTNPLDYFIDISSIDTRSHNAEIKSAEQVRGFLDVVSFSFKLCISLVNTVCPQ